MKTGWMAGVLLTVGLATAPQVRAEPPTSVQTEINYLLGSIASSGCEFYRNGSWHDANAARVHMLDKYDYLVARDMVHTTEQFIDRLTGCLSGSNMLESWTEEHRVEGERDK